MFDEMGDVAANKSNNSNYDNNGGDGNGDSRRIRMLPGAGSGEKFQEKKAVSLGVRVDESCRILFPLNFLGFNVLYWWYYLYYM